MKDYYQLFNTDYSTSKFLLRFSFSLKVEQIIKKGIEDSHLIESLGEGYSILTNKDLRQKYKSIHEEAQIKEDSTLRIKKKHSSLKEEIIDHVETRSYTL